MRKFVVSFSLLVWLIGSKFSIAETPTSKALQTYEISDLDKAPKAIKRVAPTYPKAEKKNRITAYVELEFVVDESGNVVDPKILEVRADKRKVFKEIFRAGKRRVLKGSEILETSPEPFSQSALEAVFQWKFEPGIKDGVPVKTLVNLPLKYTLRR